MKKVVLVAVLAVTSLTLFSFRSAENSSNEAEVTDVKEFSVAAKNFTDSAETFPDNFTRWRKDWVDYATIQKMNISLEEMNATLDKF
jgi:hypothetical protein